jgi:hypothetical protein
MAQELNLAVPSSNGTSCSAVPPVDAQSGNSGSSPNGQAAPVYPKRFPVLNSDTARQSPWSGKLLLSLGKYLRSFTKSMDTVS